MRSEKSKVLSSEDGIVLVMVLVLAAIALAVMAALLYMVMSRSEMSGLQKRYKTSLEASKGGADIAYQFISLRGSDTCFSDGSSDPLCNFKVFGDELDDHINRISSTFITTPTGSSGCRTATDATCSAMGAFQGIVAKFQLPTACWLGCDSSLSIDPSDNTTYDISFRLPGETATNTNYNVYAKVVDTVLGNSGSGEDLSLHGVVDPNTPKRLPVPYMYTLEVEAENAANTSERAKLSILYKY